MKFPKQLDGRCVYKNGEMEWCLRYAKIQERGEKKRDKRGGMGEEEVQEIRSRHHLVLSQSPDLGDK